MIDFHMLLTDRLPDGWQQQAIDSVHAAIERSPVPVVFHTLPESEGKFWEARWDGYQLGNNPWVSYLDADDWMEPNTFEEVAKYLTTDTDTIQTKGFLYDVPTGKQYKAHRGMRFHKRIKMDSMDKLSREGCCPSCLMAIGPTAVVDEYLVYFRTGYDSLSTQWRRANGMG